MRSDSPSLLGKRPDPSPNPNPSPSPNPNPNPNPNLTKESYTFGDLTEATVNKVRALGSISG